MSVGLVDSGLGALPTAAWLLRLRPRMSLVLSMDPARMPWGPLSDDEVAQRALLCATSAVTHGATVLVMACNTASVLALEVVRERFEPAIPVVGTVPAIKVAGDLGRPFAIWATRGTTGSPYQERLIEQFGRGLRIERVACPGLAEAIERGHHEAVERAVQQGAARTPADVACVVLGCTQYPLVEESIRRHLASSCQIVHSAEAVARQTIRRLTLDCLGEERNASEGELTVLLSGEVGSLPRAALNYESGRLLAAMSYR